MLDVFGLVCTTSEVEVLSESYFVIHIDCAQELVNVGLAIVVEKTVGSILLIHLNSSINNTLGHLRVLNLILLSLEIETLLEPIKGYGAQTLPLIMQTIIIAPQLPSLFLSSCQQIEHV